MSMKFVGSAHLAAGGSSTLPVLLGLLEKEGIEVRGNPDVYVREYARFGADDARLLREKAAARAISGARRIFVAVTPTMTIEAQNVLLKTLEEPPADAHFFFIVHAPQALLPTLRSRMQTLALEPANAEQLVDTKRFLAAPPETRLDMLKPLLEKDEDDKRDLRHILTFFGALETGLANKPEGLKVVYGARKYAADRGALLKPLLEEVALLVPKVDR